MPHARLAGLEASLETRLIQAQVIDLARAAAKRIELGLAEPVSAGAQRRYGGYGDLHGDEQCVHEGGHVRVRTDDATSEAVTVARNLVPGFHCISTECNLGVVQVEGATTLALKLKAAI
jgi:hypothetical protein